VSHPLPCPSFDLRAVLHEISTWVGGNQESI
jgi:hypothetical protein